MISIQAAPHRQDGSDPPLLEHLPSASGVRTVRSDQLLPEKSELQILHGEDVYRLRITKRGKLILTK